MLEHGNDRGDYGCGHGHPDAIKDFDTLMITPRSCPHLRLRPPVVAGQLPLIATLQQPWGEYRQIWIGFNVR